MYRHSLSLALAVAGLLAGSLAAPPARAAGTPVRCRVWINTDLTDRNVPMECTRPDGSTFVNVPEDQYLFVTDILVMPRLGSQTTVAASVRIWKEQASGTGCSAAGDAVVGSFVTAQYLELADTSVQAQLHVPYRVPYLVLTPNDCLAVYTSTAGGLVVELTGLLSTSSRFGMIPLPEPREAVASSASAAAIGVLAALRRPPRS